MRFDARMRVAGVVVNAATGRAIPYCRWADTDTGEYEAYVTEKRPDGSEWPVQPFRTYRGWAEQLRFVTDGKAVRLSLPSAVDARAAAEEMAEYQVKRNPKLMILGEECEYPGCHRLASWHVAHEKKLEHQRMSNGELHERQVLVRLFAYCDLHYRLPVSTSIRGVESEVEVQLARPEESR